jgi:hypothetical protein
LGTRVTNQNFTHEKIKKGLNSGNARRRWEDNNKVDLRKLRLGDPARFTLLTIATSGGLS